MSWAFSLGPEQQIERSRGELKRGIYYSLRRETNGKADGDWRKGPTRNPTEVTPTNQVSEFRMGFHEPTNGLSDKAAPAGPPSLCALISKSRCSSHHLRFLSTGGFLLHFLAGFDG